jgi:hypothetical protein
MTYNTPLPISGRDPDSVPFEERIAELEEAKRDPVKAIRATGFAPKFNPAPELQSLHQNYERLQESTS